MTNKFIGVEFALVPAAYVFLDNLHEFTPLSGGRRPLRRVLAAGTSFLVRLAYWVAKTYQIGRKTTAGRAYWGECYAGVIVASLKLCQFPSWSRFARA